MEDAQLQGKAGKRAAEANTNYSRTSIVMIAGPVKP